jgi:cytochrome c1
MLRQWKACLLLLALWGGCAAAQTGRGELLYLTYCIGCHSEQMHWRDRQLATSWDSLLAEVRRWQANGNLDWSAGDIEVVARHLNTIYYRHPAPGQ